MNTQEHQKRLQQRRLERQIIPDMNIEWIGRAVVSIVFISLLVPGLLTWVIATPLWWIFDALFG